jgi:hypothetical protein
MDFINQKLQSRDEILSLFRVPKSILGITDDVNRANADASVYIFALRTIKPLMQKMVDTLNEFLLPDYEEGLTLDFDNPVPEDRVAEIAEFTAGYGKWLSRNEIRAREGLEPTANGDVFSDVSTNAPVDNTVAPKKLKSKKVENKVEKPEDEKSAVEKVVDKFVAKMPKSDKKTLDSTAKELYLGSWVKRIDAHTGTLKRKVVDYFTKQEAEVQKNLREEMKGLEAKEYKLKAVSDILFDKENAVKAGINLITPFIRQYIKESGEAGNLAANGDGFEADTVAVTKFTADRATFFSESVNDTTATDLLATIQDGVNNTESLEQISQRIADVYGQAKDFRTDRIARTEVAASSNFGATQGYIQAGVEKQQWAVVNPCDICAENDNEIEAIGDTFKSGDTEAPVHPNCMCTTLPVFEE